MVTDWTDKIELVSEVVKTYDIQVTDEEFLRLVKVKDLLELVINKIQEKPDSVKPDEAVVWNELRSLIADQLGVRERDVTPEIRFYEDLNCGGKVVNEVPYNPWWEHPAFIIIVGGLAGLTTLLLILIFRN